jgi:hypothetical protein
LWRPPSLRLVPLAVPGPVSVAARVWRGKATRFQTGARRTIEGMENSLNLPAELLRQADAIFAAFTGRQAGRRHDHLRPRIKPGLHVKEDAFARTCPVLNESHLSGRADTISARHNPGADHAGVERLSTRPRHAQKSQPARGRIPTRAQDRPMRNRLVGRGRRWAIKTSPRMARGH